MYKYPIYKQDNNYSCGAYCIKMILKYHHIFKKVTDSFVSNFFDKN